MGVQTLSHRLPSGYTIDNDYRPCEVTITMPDGSKYEFALDNVEFSYKNRITKCRDPDGGIQYYSDPPIFILTGFPASSRVQDGE